MIAELAFDDLRIEFRPFESRDVEGATDFTVTAADAFVLVPFDDSVFPLRQCAEGTAGNACGIDTMHALALDERVLVTVFGQKDDVLRLCIEIGRHLPDAAGPNCEPSRLGMLRDCRARAETLQGGTEAR